MIPRYESTLAHLKASGAVPLEDQEVIAFATWLRIQKIPFTHVANERVASVQYKKKLKAMGTSAGFPDMMIFLPSGLVCVEMKRAKKSLSRVSNEQEDWIGTINCYDYAKAKVCYGAGEAIDFIKSEMKRG
ncbi:VRR-NUC domain-containing protein [Campylobacter californiensis]|uniref:VRR-NUC domain-containing protein n=1 Tax=Campylobacter californiensis TaxID=1032243 RepID=UPI0014742C5B|nr:VRR-NUC domain-containing protein [Campylobacter sp. RM12916]MBE3610501.1 VRR-NUC domain-containing protein [Campylobacter sp. RM12916]